MDISLPITADGIPASRTRQLFVREFVPHADGSGYLDFFAFGSVFPGGAAVG
jgi:hypothetical protein